jgi:biopolymer transport protein ExbB
LPTLPELFDFARELSQQGGPTMPFILGVSTLMWIVMIDRWFYLRWRHPRRLAKVQAKWAERPEFRSRTARRLRALHLADLTFAARSHLPLIRALIQALPLLGLLGTVSGLVHTFEIITVFGGENRRGIAAGISEALTATLAGLVTALSGLLFNVQLENRANAARIEAERLRRE